MFTRKHRLLHAAPEGGEPGGVPGGEPQGGEPQGGAPADWREGLPEELRGDPSLQDFKDVGGLAKSYLATKQQVGNSLRVPGEDATPEATQEFYDKVVRLSAGKVMPAPDLTNEEAMGSLYTAMGRPDEASGYEMPEVEGAPELAAERVGFLKGLAHKYGMSQRNFSGFMQEALQADADSLAAQATARQEGLAELKGEWGETFDSRRSMAVTLAEKTNAPEALMQALQDGEAGADVIRWLHTLADAVGSEANEIHKQQGGADDLVDAQEARMRAQEIREKLATMNEGHPDYQTLINKMIAYEKKAS